MPSSSPSSNPQGGCTTSGSSSSSENKAKHAKRDTLPPLFWYMETGDWARATERAKSRPQEVRALATLRTKSMADGTNGARKVSGTKRLALHHACFKLRSANIDSTLGTPSSAVDVDSGTPDSTSDLFVEVCRFVLLLIGIYPEAAGMRESRHGCLPLHLAAFASCAPRHLDEDMETAPPSPSSLNLSPRRGNKSSSAKPARPAIVSARSSSNDTANTHDTTMTKGLAEEHFTGTQTMQQQRNPIKRPATVQRASTAPTAGISVRHHHPTAFKRVSTPEQSSRKAALIPQTPPSGSSKSPGTSSANTVKISAEREDWAVMVVNALLDAYPKGIRVDSEGGRLPLHTACAGRATPRVISTLLTAYPAAARQRNKDGFLPLHLAAHWGVSQPSVAIMLLKAYPDATVGRNRWERTPLEEALCMAGENGRPHQAALVRALRKHPLFWERPPADIFASVPRPGSRNLVDMDETVTSDSSEEEKRYQAEQKRKANRAAPSPTNRKAASSSPSHAKKASGPPPPVDLKTLIKNQAWPAVLKRLLNNPKQAAEDLKGKMTRGGFIAFSGLTALHYACERRPPPQVVEALLEAYPNAVTSKCVPGGALPLHVACTWHASPQVVSLLLSANPGTCKIPDDMGNIALHCACFSGAPLSVVDALVRTYGRSVLARNDQGSLPGDICKRLRHENRKSVLAVLSSKKGQVLESHRRSHSSGSFGGIAMAAMELNEREGPPTPVMSGARRKKKQQQPLSADGKECEDVDLTALGIEISLTEHEKDGKNEMVWI